jgi:hypothetical protein
MKKTKTLMSSVFFILHPSAFILPRFPLTALRQVDYPAA